MKATLHLLIFFSLNSLVFSQPANDSCSNAENITLTTSNQTINFSINDAVLNNEVGCEGTTAQSYADVWYEFTMPVNGNLRINGQIGWNRFAVYDACGGNEIACFSSSGLAESLQMGNSYLLRVFRTASLAGNTGFQSFDIMAFESPDNETCATAENIALSTSNQSIDFSISGAEINNEEGCAGTSNTDLLDVWYEFTMPVSGNIIINGQIAWNQFSIYDACNGNEIACFSGSSVVDGMVGGDTYLLRVYRTPALAFNLNFQEFDIQAFEAIDNDTCVDATNISVDTDISTVNFDIKGAEVNNEVGCEGSSSSDYLDAWFEFTMPVSGNLNINGQIAWNQFAIYDSCGGNEIACFSDNDLVEGLEAGITYQLRVFRTLNTALNSGFQSFTTQAFEVVANDDCSGAENIALDTQQQNIDFYITGAEINTEVGCEGTAPQNYVDVWYSFEMPFSGDVFINSQIAWNNFAVYESCGGNEVHCSNTSALVQALDAGETYFLRVFRTETNATNTGFQNFSIQAFENTTNCASISIWNGSTWSNGIPDATTKAVINDNFDISTDIEWCELEIVNGKVSLLEDAKLTLNDTENSLYINPDGELEVKGILSSVGDMQIEGNLIFKSDDTSTGQLDEFNANITGNVSAERYIPAKRAFRLLSSAVSGVSIADSWQLDTHITGAGGATNGFDNSGSNNPSMFTFNNSLSDQTNGQAWEEVQNTSSIIEAGTPYRLLVRGSRATVDLFDNESPSSDVTLSATGSLSTGNLTTGSDLPAMAALQEQYSFIGNPYQAIVNVNDLNFTGDVNPDYIYIWDAKIGGENGRGGFVIVDTTTGDPVVDPTAPNPGSSVANEYIMPGQAFFIRNNETVTTSPSITFTEAAKATSIPQTEVFSTNTAPYLNLRLYSQAAWDNNDFESDALGIRWSPNYTTPVSDEDSGKLGNSGENFAVLNENTLVGIDKRNLPDSEEVIPLFINNLDQENYVIYNQFANLSADGKLFLEDHYLETSTLLNSDEVYNFSVNPSIAASFSSDRFSIRFDPETLSNEDFTADRFSIYPNPVQNQFNIAISTELANEAVQVEVFDVMGRSMLKKEVLFSDQKAQPIEAASLPSGVYLVQINAEGKTFTQRIIKM